METQTIHPDTTRALDDIVRRGHPALEGWWADQTTAYVEEIRALRRRVAMLEAELAVVHAAASDTAAVAPSVFDEPALPAVVAAPGADPSSAPTAGRAPQLPRQSPAEPPETTSGSFAEAWNADATELSFEERLAERAFFRHAPVDQASRSWLLTD